MRGGANMHASDANDWPFWEEDWGARPPCLFPQVLPTQALAPFGAADPSLTLWNSQPPECIQQRAVQSALAVATGSVLGGLFAGQPDVVPGEFGTSLPPAFEISYEPEVFEHRGGPFSENPEWLSADMMNYPGALAIGEFQANPNINQTLLDGNLDHDPFSTSVPDWAAIDDGSFKPEYNDPSRTEFSAPWATTALPKLDDAVLAPLVASPPAASQEKGKGKDKVSKKKIACPYIGCKATFSRNSLFPRHEKNIHFRSSSLLCYVHGCSRSTDPFGRPDKFNEHVRGHREPHDYVCIIEECREGPLTRSELYDHLKSSHQVENSEQDFLDHVLKAMNMRRGETLVDEEIGCPLREIGCNFRCHQSQLQQHLDQHRFVDPFNGQVITGWENSDMEVQSHTGRLDSRWGILGMETCPICNKTLFNSLLRATLPVLRIIHKEHLWRHLATHPISEQNAHVKEIEVVMQESLTNERHETPSGRTNTASSPSTSKAPGIGQPSVLDWSFDQPSPELATFNYSEYLASD